MILGVPFSTYASGLSLRFNHLEEGWGIKLHPSSLKTLDERKIHCHQQQK
jgi:hypothetical protein